MSYILDALNKSDEERQRDHSPNLKTVHGSRPRKKGMGLWQGVILILFLVNLVLLGVWLWPKLGLDQRETGDPGAGVRDQPPTADISTSSASGTIGNPSPGAQQPATSARGSGVGSRVGTGMGTGVKSVAVPQDPVTSVTSERADYPENYALEPEVPATTIYEADEVISPPPQGQSMLTFADRDVPGITLLPESVQRQIPDLSFASHIYSSLARARLVSINGRLMREGDRITGNLRLLEITEEGVILQFEEHVFKMSILRDWSFD